jgi:hypothetical protein
MEFLLIGIVSVIFTSSIYSVETEARSIGFLPQDRWFRNRCRSQILILTFSDIQSPLHQTFLFLSLAFSKSMAAPWGQQLALPGAANPYGVQEWRELRAPGNAD